jgi:hypothetical protein
MCRRWSSTGPCIRRSVAACSARAACAAWGQASVNAHTPWSPSPQPPLAPHRAQSMESNEAFWGSRSRELIQWDVPFKAVQRGTFASGDLQWFTEGKLNVSVNCIDRHLETKGDQVRLQGERGELATLCLEVHWGAGTTAAPNAHDGACVPRCNFCVPV